MTSSLTFFDLAQKLVRETHAGPSAPSEYAEWLCTEAESLAYALSEVANTRLEELKAVGE